MQQHDLDVILETGEQWPTDLSKSGSTDVPMVNPVFDGEQIVDQAKG